MHFDRLEISYLRNLESVAVDLSPGINFFFGPNGAGKTAVLEAAHVLARGRSFRAQRAKTLIRTGMEALAVRAVLEDEHRGRVTLAMSKTLAGRTELKINGLRERRLSEAARLVPLQVMLPDVAELVFDGPRKRRQWLDWGLFHVKPDYLGRLRDYLQAVRQRNAVLKEQGRRSASAAQLLAALAPWEQALVEGGNAVHQMRLEYLTGIRPVFLDVLETLAPDLTISMGYHPGWPAAESLDKVLGENRAREVKSGVTQAGPHRADIVLGIDGGRANAVLSRGQGKLVATAMMVAQARFLTARGSRSSVFLIDDVGAELDRGHSARFYEMLHEMGSQILATSTELPADGSGSGGGPGSALAVMERWGFTPDLRTLFHVEHGRVRPVSS